MMRRLSIPIKPILTGLALAASLAAPSLATPNGLAISDARLRVTIPSRPAAGFFTLKNSGNKTRTLIGATSPACKTAMLHQSKMVDGVMKMLHIADLPIQPGSTLNFAPGGYHIMCMHPSAGITSKKSVPMTLIFKNGEKLKTDMIVTGAM